MDDEKYIIKKILGHKEFVNRGKGKHRIPKNLKWHIKYKGYPKPESRDASEFLHDVNEDSLVYNRRQKIKDGLEHIGGISVAPHPEFVERRLCCLYMRELLH